MNNRSIIIAIDGPSGAGKSTLGRMLARSLKLLYLDTGAMYRAVALAVIESGINFTDQAAIIEIARQADIQLAGDPDSLQVRLNGHDVSTTIRSESVTHAASVISAISGVRREMVDRQRAMGARGGVVLDGRDISTIVFPQADIKFFLTAVPEERARRRYEEVRLKSRDSNYEDTLADINTRDRRDSTRADSPLAIAEDAFVIDSTELSLEEVFQKMLDVIREKLGEQSTIDRMTG